MIRPPRLLSLHRRRRHCGCVSLGHTCRRSLPSLLAVTRFAFITCFTSRGFSSYWAARLRAFARLMLLRTRRAHFTLAG